MAAISRGDPQFAGSDPATPNWAAVLGAEPLSDSDSSSKDAPETEATISSISRLGRRRTETIQHDRSGARGAPDLAGTRAANGDDFEIGSSALNRCVRHSRRRRTSSISSSVLWAGALAGALFSFAGARRAAPSAGGRDARQLLALGSGGFAPP